MLIPITRDDFIKLGHRYNSEDLVAEIDRLLPIARTDIAKLTTRGYSEAKLTALADLRTRIAAQGAEHRDARSAQKSARRSEGDAIYEGTLLLRSGEVLAHSAIVDRVHGAAESPEEAHAITTRLAGALDALAGRIGADSAKLRTRLTELKQLLAKPELAPHDRAATRARNDFVAKIDAVLARLPALAEAKKSAQRSARSGTDDLEELDGRAYFNLTLLTQSGRSYFRENHDPTRASEYSLSALHKRAASAAAAAAPAADAPATGSADGAGTASSDAARPTSASSTSDAAGAKKR